MMKFLIGTGFAGIIWGLAACQTSAETTDERSKVKDAVVVANAAVPSLESTLQEQGLVNIQDVDSTIRVELKYSTTDNFFGRDAYGDLTNAYLQPAEAKKLKVAQEILKKRQPNYSLLVYDAVRPHRVQKVLWEFLDSIPPRKRKDYVANPVEGSIHNYGCAVDLTIYDAARDTTLDMGTTYDYFGALAYPRKETEMLQKGLLTAEQVKNRQLLRSVMEAAGFMPITSEWWHFNSMSRKRANETYKIVK